MEMEPEYSTKHETSYKLFGIGLPRTGTTSLAVALNSVGIPTLHGAYEMFPDPLELSHPIYQKFRGFVDTPFYLLFEKANLRFPDCKFIFTTRKLDRWLESCASLWKVMTATFPPDHPVWVYVTITFGSYTFDPKRLAIVYHRHQDSVNHFFSTLDPSRYLTIDLDETVRPWIPLARFLGIAEPTISYPHSNTSEDLQKTIATTSEMMVPRYERNHPESEYFPIRNFEHWTVCHSPDYKLLGHLIASTRSPVLTVNDLTASSRSELRHVLSWACSALQRLTVSDSVSVVTAVDNPHTLQFHILPRVRFLSDDETRFLPSLEDNVCRIHPLVLARFLREFTELK